MNKLLNLNKFERFYLQEPNELSSSQPEVIVNTILWLIHERMKMLKSDILIKSVVDYFDPKEIESAKDILHENFPVECRLWRIYQNEAFAVSVILFTIFCVSSCRCLDYEFQVIFNDDVTNTSISMSHLHNRSFRLIFNFMSRSGSLAPQCDHAHLATSFILHLYKNNNISRFAAIGQFCM